MPPAVTHVVGARPNFMKAAPVVAALGRMGVEQTLVHTGQHYDDEMSKVFFRDLAIPTPDVDLGVGAGSHAEQTAALLIALERTLLSDRPAWLVVYGDVNSTLAATLVASKLGIRVAHVEAGLRSFDRTMPEEVNRIVSDALADLLFVTSPEALVHLGHEGVAAHKVHFSGNPMIDTLLGNLDRFDVESVRDRHDLRGDYALATLHRPGNVDATDAAALAVQALREITQHLPLVLPLHPRGRGRLRSAGIEDVADLHITPPLGYVEFVSLMRGASLVLTDSGGIQEETTVLGIPCLTLRPNTERPITIHQGTNRLVDADGVGRAVKEVLDAPAGRPVSVPPLWDGKAGERIAAVIGGALVGATA